MKINLTKEELSNLKKFASQNFVEFGFLVYKQRVSFVAKRTFYDNVNYDVGSDYVYDFFNIRDDAVTDFDEDISDTTIIYAVNKNEQQIKGLFNHPIIKIKNSIINEVLQVVDVEENDGDLIEICSAKFEYIPLMSSYNKFDEALGMDIENDKLKDFIHKINSVKPQNMFILNKDGEGMAFISIYGMMAFKRIGKLSNPYFGNINFTTDNAENIKYVMACPNVLIFYDKDKRIIKINYHINSEAYNLVFDRQEIVGKSFTMDKNEFIKILSKISYITSDDKSEFKLKFLKTKTKFSILKNFIVDNCVIEYPTKSSDISAKTFTFSASTIRDFVEKIDSEKLTFGIHKECVFRINSDDINFMFSELSNRTDD